MLFLGDSGLLSFCMLTLELSFFNGSEELTLRKLLSFENFVGYGDEIGYFNVKRCPLLAMTSIVINLTVYIIKLF